MVSSMRANTEGRKQENRNPHCVQRVYCVPPSPVSSVLSIPVLPTLGEAALISIPHQAQLTEATATCPRRCAGNAPGSWH